MAKKVNKPFLLILTIAVIAVGSLVLFFEQAKNAVKRVVRGDPKPYILAGQQALEAGEYQNALENFQTAYRKDSSNPDVFVGMADCYNNLIHEDPRVRLRQARDGWRQALALNPNHPVALRRMLDHWWEIKDFGAEASTFAEVRDAASKLAAVDPQAAPMATKRYHLANVLQHLGGSQVKKEELAKSRQALEAMGKADPNDADIPFFLIAWEIQDITQEEQRTGGGRKEIAKRMLAAADLAEAALKGSDGNAEMKFRYGVLRAQIAGYFLGSIDNMDAEFLAEIGFARDAPADGELKDFKAHFDAMADDAYAKLLDAAESVPPTSEYYVQIVGTVAERAIRKDRDRAGKLFEKLLADRPNDPNVRLIYARGMDGLGQRDKAVVALERPVDLTGVPGPKGVAYSGSKDEMQIRLTEARIAAMETAADPAQRDKIGTEVVKAYGELKERVNNETPNFLRLQGKVFLIQGKELNAIDSFNKSLDRMGSANSRERADTTLILARLYQGKGQSGNAIRLYRQLIESYPDYAPARLALARLYIAENDKIGAREELDAVAKAEPENRELAELSAILDSDPATYAKLPESTPVEIARKFNVAINMKRHDDAARLGEALHKLDPKNLSVAETLVRVYLQTDKKDRARALIKEMREIYPDNKGLLVAEKQVEEGATVKDVVAMSRQQLEAEKDPFKRAIGLYTLERQLGRHDEAGKFLAEAEKLQPKADAVIAARFEHALTTGDLATAEKLVEPISKIRDDGYGGNGYRLRLALAKSDVKTAVTYAKEMVKLRPDFAQSHVALGQAQQAVGNYGDAAESFTRALERQSANADALAGLIDSYLSLGETDDAKRTIDRARKVLPDNVAFRERELDFELNYGDPEKVVAARRDLYEKDKQRIEPAINLAGAILRTVRAKYPDNEEMKAKLLAEARKPLEDFIAAGKEDARLYATLADALLLGGQKDAGEKLLKDLQATETNKDRAGPHLLLADYYVNAGDYQSAETQMRAALGKAENKIDLSKRLAAFLMRVRKFEPALRALDPYKDSLAVARQRIEIMLTGGMRTDAGVAIEEALKASPESTELKLLRVVLHIDSNQLELARAAVDDTLKSNPRSEMALYYKGLIAFRSGDTEGAIREWSSLRERNPKFMLAIVQLADAFRKAGRTADAVSELRAALEMSPLNREIRVKLLDILVEDANWPQVTLVAQGAMEEPRLKNDAAWPRAAGLAAAAQRQFVQATKLMRQAHELVPDNALILRDYLQVLLQAGDPATVLKETDALATNNPAWWVLQYRGLAHAALKNRDGATSDLDQAFDAAVAQQDRAAVSAVAESIATVSGPEQAVKKLQPLIDAAPGWRMVAGNILLRAGQPSDVLTMVEPLMQKRAEMQPAERAPLLRMVATSYQLLKPTPEFDKAAATYEELLKDVPDDIETLNNLGYLLSEEVSTPNLPKASEYGKRAYDILQKIDFPNEPNVIDTYAWTLILQGGKNLDTGVDLLKDVTRQAPQLVEARYHLGMGLMKLDQPGGARIEFNEGLAIIDAAKKAKRPTDPRLESRLREGLAAAEKKVALK